MRKHLKLYAFPRQESGGKCIWNITPEISNLSQDPTITAENEEIIFVTCILHNYPRGQGLGLSDMGRSANDQSNLTKIPNQGGSAHQSAFEVREKLKQIFNTPSGSVSRQNERVQCYANL
jgi:hypothetical protein